MAVSQNGILSEMQATSSKLEKCSVQRESARTESHEFTLPPRFLARGGGRNSLN